MKKIFKTFFLCLVAVFAVNANAISSSDRFEGEYSIDYLLRNYDVVTLGMNNVYNIDFKAKGLLTDFISPGEVKGIQDINGSVLINGTLSSNVSLLNNYDNPNPAPSYIKNVTSDTTFGSGLSYSSNIYLGTGNNSYSNPNNMPVAKTDDYIDFEKLYYSILNQQSDMRAEAVNNDYEFYDNHYRRFSNGNYELSLSFLNIYGHGASVYVDNNNNDLYAILNIDDVVITELPRIYVNDAQYQNVNVILNCPNARYIYIGSNSPYHIIAPKADIVYSYNSDVYGTIIANSIWYYNPNTNYNYSSNIRSQHLTCEDGLYNSNISDARFGHRDINDDLYEGDYSIDELLRNYNLVVFGKNTNTPASIYHVVGNVLVNGRFGKDGVLYSQQVSDYRTLTGSRLDTISFNKKYASYINWRNTSFENMSRFVLSQHYIRDNHFTLYDSENKLIYPFWLSQPIYFSSYISDYYYGNDLISNNYIDFDYLYNNIIEKQAYIRSGESITKDSNNYIDIETGGYYNIDNVDDTMGIYLRNFVNNNAKTTVITINQEGEITMPRQITDYYFNEYTNDFYGKNRSLFGRDKVVKEYYYGNVVYNFPNATKITFPEDNSFKGHIIAPKAEIVIPEMNLAGCVIADSIDSSGFSELHYYPLSLGDLIYDIPEPEPEPEPDPEPDPEPEPEPEPEPDPETELDAYAEIKGKIVWSDENDKDAIRPSYVVVHFYADGVEIATKKVYEADNWQFCLEVPVDKEGKVTYTIDNDDVSGYVFDYNETSKYNYEITVSHKIKGVKGEVENPKTGLFNIVLLFIPLIILVIVYVYLSKKKRFKNV